MLKSTNCHFIPSQYFKTFLHNYQQYFELISKFKVIWNMYTPDNIINDITEYLSKMFGLKDRQHAERGFRKNIKLTSRSICPSFLMAESASRQDEAHPAFCLATRLARPRFPALVPQVKVLFLRHVNPLTTKLVRSRWPNIGLEFCVFLLTETKRTWPISSHLDLTFGQ